MLSPNNRPTTTAGSEPSAMYQPNRDSVSASGAPAPTDEQATAVNTATATQVPTATATAINTATATAINTACSTMTYRAPARWRWPA